jgi:hypothetical protein
MTINIVSSEDLWVAIDDAAPVKWSAHSPHNVDLKQGMTILTQDPTEGGTIRPDGTLTNQSDPFQGEPGATPGAPGGD